MNRPALMTLLVLAPLACSRQPIIETRTVTVSVPVTRPLPPELLADTPPETTLSESGPLYTIDILAYLTALETALTLCRDQLAAIVREVEEHKDPVVPQ